MFFVFFFFNDTATTEIYTLSLHDALPICPEFSFERRGLAYEITIKPEIPFEPREPIHVSVNAKDGNNNVMTEYQYSFSQLMEVGACPKTEKLKGDRKSTRLNSSHTDISRMPSSAWKKKTKKKNKNKEKHKKKKNK